MLKKQKVKNESHLVELKEAGIYGTNQFLLQKAKYLCIQIYNCSRQDAWRNGADFTLIWTEWKDRLFQSPYSLFVVSYFSVRKQMVFTVRGKRAIGSKQIVFE